MIEKTILDYLNEKLDVTAYMERPESQPASYVIIEKTGSSESDQVTTSTFAFQSCAKSLAEAAALNELVKSAVKESVELPGIGGVHLNTDYNYTKTESKQYRYQAVFLITHY